jgi:serine protease
MRMRQGVQATVEVLPADYGANTGTSMAAPHVTGVAALLWSAHPTLTADALESVLLETARDVGEPGPDVHAGAGLVQARAALDRLASQPEPE